MATASILDGSDEKSNGSKLMRLIVDGGTEALRKTFTRYHPGNLQTVLSAHKPSLLKLRHKRIINQSQWDELFPPPPNLPNINDFDITLLSVLLRNICGLTPPGLGWDKMPNISDFSVEADIVRVKLFRNERFGHIPNTCVNLTDFTSFWKEISSPLVRLGIDQKEIDRLENEMCHSDRVLNKHLVSFDFQGEIETYHGKFTKGTREWVMDEVSTWFNDESSPNRAFIITGLAGMGKSVIAGVICKRFSEYVAASHFFQYNNSEYNNPKFVLQSLARHLCNTVPQYKEALIVKVSSNLGLSLNDKSIEGLFSILLKEPFSCISDPGKRILIVLDALDESEYNGRDEFGSLVSSHLHKLPSYIRFVVTTRPEKNLIHKFEKLNPLYIEANDERNLSDLKLVLRERIPSGNTLNENRINSLAKKCDGLMLYAFFLSEIYNDEFSIVSNDSLPKGVEEYYEMCFKRLKCEFTTKLEIPEDVFFSFLSALVVAKEPLPETFLKTLFGFENFPRARKMVRKAINSISSLFVIKADQSISFFHKSVRDWLVDNTEHDYSVDVTYGHQILSDLCVKKLNELKERGVSNESHSPLLLYALKYYIPHMLNRRIPSGKLECCVSDYVTDLEVIFASVRLNVDLTLYNLTSLVNHEMYNDVSEQTRATVNRLFFLIRKSAFLLRDYPQTFLQNVVNEGGEELSLKASTLLKTRYKDILYLELVEKDSENDAVEARWLLSGRLSSIAISPKHDYVVCSYDEGGVELFSLTTGTLEWKIQDLKVELPSDTFSLLYTYLHLMWPRCIVFHPLEDLILPGRLDQVLTLQGEFTTGPFQCDQGSSKFTNCCFSLDGSIMVTHYGYNLFVWNISSGENQKCLLQRTLLVSLSFSASGKFLGTTDIQNVFNVYDVMNDYNAISDSSSFKSDSPLEIISTYDQNSWLCSVERYLTIVSYDLTIPSHPRPDVNYAVLPFSCSDKQQCCLTSQPSWFSSIRKVVNFTSLRYLLVGNKSVLILFNASNIIHVLSIHALFSSDNTSITNTCRNKSFHSVNNRLALKKHVCKLCEKVFQRNALVVKGGVIIHRSKDTPELWNLDKTKCLARFEQLAGTRECLSVSDEIIACVFQSSVIFFNVFTREIRSTTIFNNCAVRVHACSVNYHVFGRVWSGDLSLWKDGTRVDGWESNLSALVNYAKFSPKGNILAFCSSCYVYISDIVSLGFLAKLPISTNINDFLELTFFDHENFLCSSTNHMLYFINAKSGKVLTCIDVGDYPAPLNVCSKQSIVIAGLNNSVRFKLIKVWLPRK